MQELSFDSRHELVPRVRDNNTTVSSDESKLYRFRHLIGASSSLDHLPICPSMRRFRFNDWTPDLEGLSDDDDDVEEPIVEGREESSVNLSRSPVSGGIDAELMRHCQGSMDSLDAEFAGLQSFNATAVSPKHRVLLRLKAVYINDIISPSYSITT